MGLNFRQMILCHTIVFLLLTLPVQGNANDTIAAISGGGIRFLETSDISMESERLSISLEKVRVDYLFRNKTDRDITTTVAFPVPEYTYHYESPIYALNPRDFGDFKVLVDGREVPFAKTVKAMVGDKDYAGELEAAGVSVVDFGGYDPDFGRVDYVDRIDELEGGDRFRFQFLGVIGPDPEPDWPQWTVKVTYHWEQTFPAGKTVEISHSYSPYYGGHFLSYQDVRDTYAGKACLDGEELTWLKDRWEDDKWGGVRYVPYVLTTGGNWSGPIGKFVIEVIIPNDAIASACFPEPLRPVGERRKIAAIKDFSPARDLRVFYFTPPGK